MPVSLPVVLILVTLWITPAVIIAFACGSLADASPDSSPKTTTVVKGLRAEVKDLDLDARTGGRRGEYWSGSYAAVEARVTNASHEVMVLSPYAETSVRVGLSEEVRERRRCSLCMN